MTVTFCGHGDIYYNSDVKLRLTHLVEKCIKLGAEEFLLGGYGRFDFLAAQVVNEVKEQYPHIKSVFATPYMDIKYDKDLYDCSEYPPLENVPKRFAISKRNEWMVDRADIVIAYVIREFGGAAKTFEYAKRKGKAVFNAIGEYKINTDLFFKTANTDDIYYQEVCRNERRS